MSMSSVEFYFCFGLSVKFLSLFFRFLSRFYKTKTFSRTVASTSSVDFKNMSRSVTLLFMTAKIKKIFTKFFWFDRIKKLLLISIFVPFI